MCYGELTEIFQELDHRARVIIEDLDEIKTYRNSIKQLRVHIFLTELDDDIDQIQREFLRRDLVPNLKECYSLIRQEAVSSTTLKSNFGAPEASAMVAWNYSN